MVPRRRRARPSACPAHARPLSGARAGRRDQCGAGAQLAGAGAGAGSGRGAGRPGHAAGRVPRPPSPHPRRLPRRRLAVAAGPSSRPRSASRGLWRRPISSHADRQPGPAPPTQAERAGELALAAVQSGREALARGDVSEAVAWLERACRYAPEDPSPLLSLAAARLAAGDLDAAASGFRSVAQRCDLREAWLGEAVACLRLGRTAAAVVALRACLSRHRWDGSGGVADAVAEAARLPGWCALAVDGTVAVGRCDPGRCVVAMDGAVLPAGGVVPAAARRIEVTLNGAALLGSPIEAALIHRVEGVVRAWRGGLEGWAWHPGDADRDPVLLLDDGVGTLRITATDQGMNSVRPLSRPRRFAVAAEALAGFAGPIAVTGADGGALSGSPLDPGAPRRAAAAAARQVAADWPLLGAAARRDAGPALLAVPAEITGLPAAAPSCPARPVVVVVPAYRGRRETLDCLAALRRTVPEGSVVLVVDDASPEPALAAALDGLATGGAIRLLRLERNRGFPGAANAGLRAAAALPGARDVVLLNSDTRAAPGWLERLRARGPCGAGHRHRHAAVQRRHHRELPRSDAGQPAARRRGACLPRPAGGAGQSARGGGDPDRHRVLHVSPPRMPGAGRRAARGSVRAGLRRGERLFPARPASGLAACGGAGRLCRACGRAFVRRGARGADRAQHGGAGAGASRLPRADRGLDRGRSAASGAAAAGRAALARDVSRRAPRGAAGDTRFRRRRGTLRARPLRRDPCRRRTAGAAAPRARPLRARRAALERAYLPGLCRIDEPGQDWPNLRFGVAEEIAELAALLGAARPRRDRGASSARPRPRRARSRAPPGRSRTRSACTTTPGSARASRWWARPGAIAGSRTAPAAPPASPIWAAGWRRRSPCRRCWPARPPISPRLRAWWRRRATRRSACPGIFPSVRPVVEPHETDDYGPLAPLPPGCARKICVVGAIGQEKGYDVLLACARDAASRDLDLRFVVVGHTVDDARLFDTGRVTSPGRSRRTRPRR